MAMGMFVCTEISSSQKQDKSLKLGAWSYHPHSYVGSGVSDLSYEGFRQPLFTLESLIKKQVIHFSAYI